MFLLNKIDALLNSYTMYRVVLYGLIFLSAVAIIFGFLNILPYSGIQFILSLILIIAATYSSNKILSIILKAGVNVESWIITALILFLVLAPINNFQDFLVTAIISIVAMASKFFLAYDKKHIFNPAAISMFLAGLFGFGNSIWWVGSLVMLPFVTIVGLLVVRKVRRFQLLFTFIITAVISVSLFNLRNSVSIGDSLYQVFTSWPLIFFGTIMLTEPFTTPPGHKYRTVYGIFVGLLFGSQFSLGPLYASPEFALVAGNILSFILSPKGKLMLEFKSKTALAPTIYEFAFSHSNNFNFIPGQYLEWTLPHKSSDDRGVRRYFTIASSPEEKEVKLGVKVIPDKASSYKKALLNLKPGDKISADQLTGDFVLPKDQSKKFVFIAGGIGVTPFRSMIQTMLLKNEKKDIVMFYSTANTSEYVYKDIFASAINLGLKTIYLYAGKDPAPKNWQGEIGFLNEEMIKKYVPDYKTRIFYLSGPVAMVNNYKSLLAKLGIPNTQIVTDYFPGF